VEWRVKSAQVVVLYVGRIVRDKGMFELLEALSLAAATNPKIICVLVGSKPAFDEITIVQKKRMAESNSITRSCTRG
jgi:glycosyltransferase involved in cell wall biosynthesis